MAEGEQGVLIVEPYKSEILPFWKNILISIPTAPDSGVNGAADFNKNEYLIISSNLKA